MFGVQKFSLQDCPKILLQLFEEDTLLFLLVGKLWLKAVYEEVIFVSEICPMSRSGSNVAVAVECRGRGSNVAVAGPMSLQGKMVWSSR